MIYSVWAITQGGIVLWYSESFKASGNPISSLVKQILLLEKSGDSSFTSNDHQFTLQWITDNLRKVYFVIITPKAHPVAYSTTLLQSVRKSFVNRFCKEKKEISPWVDCTEFQTVYEELIKKEINKTRAAAADKKPKKYTPKQKTLTALPPREGEKPIVVPQAAPVEEPEPAVPSMLSKLMGKKPTTPVSRGGKKSRKGGASTKKPTTAAPTTKGKKKRTWGDEPDDSSYDDDPNSDDSQSTPTSTNSSPQVPLQRIDINAHPEEDEDEEEESAQGGFFSRYLPSLTGRTLTAKDLDPLMEQFQHHLNAKNVAANISASLCESVKKSLEGTHISTFASAQALVKTTLTQSVTRILTPKRQVDVLNDIDRANRSGRPYSIVFVGVNGVGKSTSLSKVASWLLQNEKSLLIAACDTFRSGAVEQLKVHASRLNVPVFDQGYSSDPSHVAKFAIKKAASEKTNVVLVDTAGRMQDNEPLMTALSNLVHYNNPDLVLFVGEALVGNDGVHQLTSFNDALKRLSSQANMAVRKKENVIDGIILTKFDTIDDKVGAAVSMVYSTGIPIMFVGVGQHYHDIKSLNVDTVVRSLMQ